MFFRPKQDVRNKVVVITGAGGGLGNALCKVYAGSGAKVVGVDIDAQALEKTAESMKKSEWGFHGFTSDITDKAVTARLATRIRKDFGGIDILINNAGISHRSPFSHTNIDVIEKVMAVNFDGALYWTYAALPSLIERRGSIIAISSVAGFSPLIGRTGYAASKHALHGLFESLRTEVEPLGVFVMMVCPSFIDTGINESALRGDGQPVGRDRVMTGRMLQPDDTAKKILDAMIEGKRMICIGWTAKLAYWLSRILPRVYEKGMAKRLAGEIAA